MYTSKFNALLVTLLLYCERISARRSHEKFVSISIQLPQMNEQHAAVIASSTASKLLAYGETTWKWTSPMPDCQADSKVTVEIDTDKLIYQTRFLSSTMSEKLLTMTHEEITLDMVDLLNKHLNLFPDYGTAHHSCW
ncbi:hypothetical protein BJV82DRAFT_369982 [Fennellomyces sp. T-0311]|nr:hypothetical protein BJV82DRAFT_369982 [Fennellomyces sp. T-0311]